MVDNNFSNVCEDTLEAPSAVYEYCQSLSNSLKNLGCIDSEENWQECRKQCKYGQSCKKRSCVFSHPDVYHFKRQEEQDKEISNLREMLEEAYNENEMLLCFQKKLLTEKEDIERIMQNESLMKDEQIDTLQKYVTEAKNKYNFILEKIEGMVECPICLDIPRSGPVFNCPNGHLISGSTCKPKLNNCPSCKSDISDTKSRLAIDLLENVPHRCIFEDEGCLEKYTRDRMTDHSKECDFRIVPCPSCAEKVSLFKVVAHCLDDCKVTRLKDNSVSWDGFNTFNYTMVTTGQNSTWNSLLFIGENSNSSCVLKVRMKNSIMEVVAIMIGNGDQGKAHIVVHEKDAHPNQMLTSSLKYFGELCTIDVNEEDQGCYGLFFKNKALSTLFPSQDTFDISLKLIKNQEYPQEPNDKK